MCKAGHLATRKKRHGKTGTGKNPTLRYYFDVKKCQTCPFQEGCYKKRAKSKTYSVSIKSTEQTDQEAFQNSELKHRHGYNVASSSGLLGMELQEAMAIFTVNLKRIVKLMEGE
ncbi:hypothetical protein GCM10020331_077280 [Ectobacillus funiculus]